MAGALQHNCFKRRAGAGVWSDIFNQGFPAIPPLEAPTAPSAPTLVSAVPGAGSALLTFTSPTNNGGSAITSYVATCTASGNPTVTANAAANATTATVAGLISGVVYSCSVVANNSAGASVASNVIAVTPTSIAPIATITAPANATTVNALSPITVSVNGQSQVGTVASIELLDGTTRVNIATLTGSNNNTINFTGVQLIAGVHTLTAKVTDSVGNVGTSPAITITALAAPTVTLSSASAFNLAPASIDLYAAATANATPGMAGNPPAPTVTSVALYNGTSLITTLTSPPYNFRWANVAAGTYVLTAKATDSNGVTATSTPITITVGPASAISIAASPSLNGSSTTEDNAYIGGNIQAPPNSAVTINGQLAITTPDGQFFINHLPLQPGSNIIILTITAPDGQTATQTISITRNVPTPPPPNTTGPPIFAVTVEQGGTLVPNTTLAVPVTMAIINGGALAAGTTADLSCKDPLPAATVNLTASSTVLACVYDAAGLYTVSVTIKNAANAILYTTTRQVKVEAAVEKIRTARAVYVDLIDRLTAGNKAGALNLFADHAQATYDDVFTKLGTDLATAASQLGVITQVTSSNNVAEVVVMRDVAGVIKTFAILLMRGEDGIWHIESM